MKPGPLNLPPIYRGCDWPAITLVWLDNDGNPADIRHFTPFAQTVTGVNLNPVKTQPLHGVTTLSLDKVATAKLRLGKVDWDWIWQGDDTNGNIKYPPFLAGLVEVLEPKTHVFNTT